MNNIIELCEKLSKEILEKPLIELTCEEQEVIYKLADGLKEACKAKKKLEKI